MSAEKKSIEKFTFYKNTFLLLDILSKSSKNELSYAILNYMFNDEEPDLKTKEKKAIWLNIKMTLDKQKVKINNGLNGGAPIGNTNAKKTTKKTTKETTKDTSKKTTNNILYFRFYILDFKFNTLNLKYNNNNIDKLKQYIIKWLEYKHERKEIYKERGLNALLTQIENNANEYGIDKVCDLINECMASNYKGIIFDKLKNQNEYMSYQDKKQKEYEEVKRKFLEGG